MSEDPTSQQGYDVEGRVTDLLRAIGGLLLLVAGALLLLPMPEAGLPLILLGLRLLGPRYAWARAANAWIDARYYRFRTWLRRQPGWARPLVIAGPPAAIFGLLYIAMG